LLWRGDDQVVIACAFVSMSLFGSKKVTEPVPFTGIRLGKKMYQGKAKVMAQGGRQVPAIIAIEETNVVVEGQVGGVVPRSNMPVFDVVTVFLN